ncbi:MAG: hypothetical protein E6J01_17650, partial [Chloroflexi bacterium]
MSVRVTVDNPLTYRKIAVISDAEDPRSPRPGVARGVVPPAGRKPLSREPKREVVGHCHVLLLLAGALAAGPAVAAEVKPVGSAAGDARTFIETAERRLQDLSIRVDRADWVQQNFITTDTEEMAAHAKEDLIAAVMEYARQARRFERLKLPDDVARKLALLKQSVELPAPTDPSERAELTRIVASLESTYGRGR